MSSDEIKQKLYDDIVDTFLDLQSVKDTAEVLGTYPIKVRRVLITEGLWESSTSRSVCSLHEQGLSVKEIAERLVISEKNVQSYLPYSRGQYGGENRSNEAERSEAYRDRKKLAGEKQILNNLESAGYDVTARKQKARENMKVDIMKERRKQAGMDRPAPFAMKLHLELDVSDRYGYEEDELKVLRKYGAVENSIARDIIVPGDISLRSLHYAINKIFGWQNSHLHCFTFTKEDFKQMVKNDKFIEWAKLAGVYFRFPSDDYEDIYWDDDYSPSVSVKSWFKRKYTGPYYYGGQTEYYDDTLDQISSFTRNFPMISVLKPFNWTEENAAMEAGVDGKTIEKSNIEKVIPVEETTIDELYRSILFEGRFEELVERIPLCDILLKSDAVQDFTSWKVNMKRVLKNCEKERDIRMPLTYPIVKTLKYANDYGDDWNVTITCDEIWQEEEDYANSGYPTENMNNHCPVCIEADGLPLVDDVGGLSGYCQMLEALHGSDVEEKESYKVWARSMGWTGRKIKPEKML